MDITHPAPSTAAGPEATTGSGPKPRIPDCPLARTVAAVGHWWTLEILHEVFDGHTHVDAIRRNLETPDDVLRERLDSLVARGLLDPVPGPGAGHGGPARYRLTDRGRALRPLILVMAAWGNRHLSAAERSLVVVDSATGVEVDPVVVDRATGRRIDTGDHVFARGPKASALIAARYPEIPERP